MDLFLKFRIFFLCRFNNHHVQKYLISKPTYQEVLNMLGNINRESLVIDTLPIKEYLLKLSLDSSDLVNLISYFPELKTEEFIKRCSDNKRNYGDFGDVLRYNLAVSYIVEAIIRKIHRTLIYTTELYLYLNHQYITKEQKNTILENWLKTKNQRNDFCYNASDMIKILNNCPDVRDNKALLNELVYLRTLEEFSIKPNIQKSSNVSIKTTPPMENSDLVDDLIILGTTAVIGASLASMLSSSDSNTEFSGFGGGEFGGAGSGDSF